MKKVTTIICLLLIIAPLGLLAESLGDWKAGYGDWKIVDGRLTQTSLKAGMAMANLPVPQSGVMQYEFEGRYIDGLQDQYGGFGIHIFVDRPLGKKSWGSGHSYLLWLTYDPKAYGGSGLYAQAYKSTGHSVMGLMHKGNDYQIPAEILKGIDVNNLGKYFLPVKIVVDTNTGSVKVYDPLRANYYYRFTLGGPLGKGGFIGLRTNSLAGNFSNIKVTRLE